MNPGASELTVNNGLEVLFFTFNLNSYNTNYLITLLTKKLYPTTSTIPCGAKTINTSWQHKTGNTNIALHVTTLRREWKEIEENRTISWDNMKIVNQDALS